MRTLTLVVQVCKLYVPWGVKYVDVTYFGLFGSPALGSNSMQLVVEVVPLSVSTCNLRSHFTHISIYIYVYLQPC